MIFSTTTPAQPSFTKHGSPIAIEAEAAGLRELGRAARAGGAPTVKLLDYPSREHSLLPPTSLVTARLEVVPPTVQAAEEFGRRLAFTHAFCPEGARVFGQAPSGATKGVMGNAPLRLVEAGAPSRTFGQFYGEDRLLAYLPQALANSSIDTAGARIIEKLAERLNSGIFDSPQPSLVTTEAALIHGDLWSGNLMWVPQENAVLAAEGAEPSLDNPRHPQIEENYPKVTEELKEGRPKKRPENIAFSTSGTDKTSGNKAVGVLIDPACQGGHAESDLAQLTVFGAPHVEKIYAAYNEVSPLAQGWRERIALHRLHILIVHAALFGGSYGKQTVNEALPYC